MKLFLILAIFALMTGGNAIAQCDTAFFDIKRHIVKTAVEKVDSLCRPDTSSKVVHFLFSNFTSYGYVVGNPHSTVGFFYRKVDTCDSFPYKNPYTYIHGTAYSLADKNNFDDFMDGDEFGETDLHKTATDTRVCDNPVEGWSTIERYYFLHHGFYSYAQQLFKYSITFTIPVYVFKNRNLTNAFMVAIEWQGLEKEQIKVKAVKSETFP